MLDARKIIKAIAICAKCLILDIWETRARALGAGFRGRVTKKVLDGAMGSSCQKVVEGYVQYPFVVKQWCRRGGFASTPVGPHQASWPHAGGSERRFHGAYPRALRPHGQSVAAAGPDRIGSRADGGLATGPPSANRHLRTQPEPQASAESRRRPRRSAWPNPTLSPWAGHNRQAPRDQGPFGAHGAGWQPPFHCDQCRSSAATAPKGLIAAPDEILQNHEAFFTTFSKLWIFCAFDRIARIYLCRRRAGGSKDAVGRRSRQLARKFCTPGLLLSSSPGIRDSLTTNTS